MKRILLAVLLLAVVCLPAAAQSSYLVLRRTVAVSASAPYGALPAFSRAEDKATLTLTIQRTYFCLCMNAKRHATLDGFDVWTQDSGANRTLLFTNGSVSGSLSADCPSGGSPLLQAVTPQFLLQWIVDPGTLPPLQAEAPT